MTPTKVSVAVLTQLAKPIPTPTIGSIAREAYDFLPSLTPAPSATRVNLRTSSPVAKIITTTPFDDNFIDFIGTYRLGDGLGMNLILSVNLNYTYSFQGYTDTLASWGKDGIFSISNDSLQLVTEEYAIFEPHTLFPVKWDQRRYLIDDGRISEFCEWVKKGWEPRDRLFGFFFLRAEDWKIPADGFPTDVHGDLVCS
jgi:hypothetical protein